MNTLRPAIRSTLLMLSIALCCIALPAHAKQLLHNIELDWRPTSKTVVGGGKPALAGMTIQLGKFGDARANRSLIGENREEADEGTVLPVSTVTDVPAWVTQHLKEVLQRNGVTVVESGAAVVLDGDVQRFFVEETNNYRADIVLHLRVRDAGGAVLWETNLSANAARFGRSYTKENYCEALSDSLVSLAHALLNHGQLRAALAGGAPRPADLAPIAEDPIVDAPVAE
jgi:hypothetical protein